MAVPVVFTSNCSDQSNDNGFQWEFRCERCTTVHRSAFQQNYLSRGRGVLRSMRDLLGDRIPLLHKVSSAADSYSNSWGGSASSTKDAAFAKAVDEVAREFRLCAGCGSWTCARICWNDHVGQCTNCSPQVGHQIAQAQAAARGAQIHQAAQRQEWSGQHDLGTPARVACPTCAATTDGGRFCPSCGSALDIRIDCQGCGSPVGPGALFCSNCGRAR
ncbi:zinc ribbon domain-containing protein [Nocardia sp. NPDC056541]|uniref:zinc ribbon domain-containing protein n=1 Tax=unclassified Nocardia TaxID=2637762 RepID=UPI00366AB379